MNQDNNQCYPFPNIGYLASMLTDQQLLPIRAEIEEIMKDYSKAKSMNSNLAGNIRKEFELVDSFNYLEELLYPYLHEYNETYYITHNITSIVLEKDRPQPELKLLKTWVNVQEKTEFNPIHQHHGIFSFVIWSKLPFTFENEIARTPEIPKDRNRAGHFQFYYTDVLGDIKTLDIPADRQYQNSLLIFPAKLKHGVLPFFTTDESRITISGNFGYKL